MRWGGGVRRVLGGGFGWEGVPGRRVGVILEDFLVFWEEMEREFCIADVRSVEELLLLEVLDFRRKMLKGILADWVGE